MRSSIKDVSPEESGQHEDSAGEKRQSELSNAMNKAGDGEDRLGSLSGEAHEDKNDDDEEAAAAVSRENTIGQDNETRIGWPLKTIIFDEKFHRILHDICAVSGSPGWAVGVIKGSDLVCLSNGVSRQSNSKDLPVDELTLFKLGSCSEILTGLLLNGMIDHGYIDWDDPVSKYVPELAGSGPNPGQVQKIEDALTFGPRSPQQPAPEQSYWDCRTIRDLALNRCYRLPPTDAGFGLHSMPKLDQAGLIRTIKYYSENNLRDVKIDTSPPISTAFTYALLGLIIDRVWAEFDEDVGKENNVGLERPGDGDV